MSSSLVLFNQIKFNDFVETCVPENKNQIMMCFFLKTDMNEWVPVNGCIAYAWNNSILSGHHIFEYISPNLALFYPCSHPDLSNLRFVVFTVLSLSLGFLQQQGSETKEETWVWIGVSSVFWK